MGSGPTHPLHPRPEVIREAPTLRYNYLSEATKPLERPTGMPSPRELLAVLKGVDVATLDAKYKTLFKK